MHTDTRPIGTSTAIIIAGVIIAIAVIITNNRQPTDTPAQTNDTPPAPTLDQMTPITDADHILGNPNAPIIIVEYSDFECPFCKQFHNTMQQLMNTYGASGELAWVYRHFPLDQLHPVKARQEAIASECVAELGGNDAFWQFADAFFAVTPSNNRTDLETVLPQIVTDIGIPLEQFQSCVNSGQYDAHVQNEYENALATGGSGTPWSIIVLPDNTLIPINGAQPLSALEPLIKQLLNEL